MTWAAQVRHVFVRNAADTWVSLAVAVAFIAVVATQAVLGLLDEMWGALLLDYAVRLAILCHLAILVQSDPPPNPTSFWSTQPRIPSAVATAKVLHALLMLLLIVVASLITQSAWHFSSGAGWEATGAQLRYAAIGIMPVVTMAALYSAHPRSGFSAALLCLSYGNLAEQGRGTREPLVPSLSHVLSMLPSWSWVPLSILLVAVVVWRYGHAGLPRRSEWIVTVLALLPLAVLSRREVVERPRVDDFGTALPLSISLETRGDYISFELQAPFGLPGDAYRLVNWVLLATRRDGSTVTLNGSDKVLTRSDGRDAVVHLSGDSLRVIGGEFLDMHDSTSFHSIAGSFGVFSSPNFDDVMSARLEGEIESYRMQEVDRFPLRNGLAFLRDGRRAALTILPPDTSGPGIALRTRWLGGVSARQAAWPVPSGMRERDLSFALVNRARGSMLPLRAVEYEYYGIGTTKMGFGVKAYDYVLRPAIWTLPVPPVDSAWLSSAEVVVGSPVLEAVRRIRVDGVVTPPRTRSAKKRPRV